MQTWQQLYTPLGGLGLSALVALIPIIFFFLALAVTLSVSLPVEAASVPRKFAGIVVDAKSG